MHGGFLLVSLACINIPQYAQANVTLYYMESFVLKGFETMYLIAKGRTSFEVELHVNCSKVI